MSEGMAYTILNETFYEILVLSVPLLGAAMIIGLIISIFQATTSIQEQTLTFVPKLIVVILMLMFFGPFFLTSLSEFTLRLFDLIATAKV